MLPIDRQRELQKQKELNDNARAKADAQHIAKPTRSSVAYANEVFIGGGSNLSSGLWEPAITKTIGYATWNGTSWVFLDESYSLSTHNHDLVYAPLLHTTQWGDILNHPTTLVGYGITDTFFDGQWSSILNHPTTISGYGITDAFDGSFYSLTNRPTTIAGYGITDAFNGAYSSLTGLPSLVDIYGTPVADQLTTWYGPHTIQGSPYMSFTGGTLNITGNVNMTGTFTIGEDPGNNLWQYMPVISTEIIDGILHWATNTYIPYSDQGAGIFDSGLVDPTDTTRLNYNGYLHGTRLYGDIYTDHINEKTSTHGVEIDGTLIKDYIIDAQDGSLKHMTITAGDASGVAGTDAGNMYVRAGNAILNDANSTQGALYLVPGNQYTTGHASQIWIGDSNSNVTAYNISATGVDVNVGLTIITKGAGTLSLTSTTGQVNIQGGSSILLHSNTVYVVGPSPVVSAGTVYDSSGTNLIITGGDVGGFTGDRNGGNISILGGQPYGAGTHGNIFIGTGSAGTAPLVGSGTGTSTLMYNRTTGQVTYGDVLTSVTVHNVLSTIHGDTLADTVVQGDIIYGNSTPKWARLPFPVTPTGKILQATATDVAWSANPLTIGASASVSGSNTGDQTLSSLGAQAQLNGTGFVKASGTTISYDNSTYLTTVTAHNLLSTTHGDTTAASVVRGSVIVGDSTPKWVSLAFPGTPTGKVLIATATDVAWSTSALGTAAYTNTGDYSPALVDDILDFQTNKYTPYAAKSAGKFDIGTVAPSNTNRLNYDGYLYGTKFYGLVNAVSESSESSIYAGNISTGCCIEVVTSTIGVYSLAGGTGVAGQFQSENNSCLSLSSLKRNSLAIQHGTPIPANPNTGNAIYIVRYCGGSADTTGHLISIDDIPDTSGWVSGSILHARIGTSAFDYITRIDLNPRVLNIHTAVAHLLDTHLDITSEGAKMFEVRNHGVNKFHVMEQQSYSQRNIVTDYDGNEYHTVIIGDQEWTVENFRCTHNYDGVDIPLITNDGSWAADTGGAYCYYNNYTTNIPIYGLLYNWYAWDIIISDAAELFAKDGVVDKGWRLPSDSDFNKLIEFLGGEDVAGGRMKEMGLAHWTTPNTDATNSSGFTSLPGGYRATDGTYGGINEVIFNWTQEAGGYYAGYNNSAFRYDGVSDYEAGYSIRCVRDVSTKVVKTATPAFANPLICDATVYKNFVCGTITGDTTITLQNTSDGDHGFIKITIDGTGGYTVGGSGLGSLIYDASGYNSAIATARNNVTLIEYWNINGDILRKINYID